jgi:hypothetical protein
VELLRTRESVCVSISIITIIIRACCYGARALNLYMECLGPIHDHANSWRYQYLTCIPPFLQANAGKTPYQPSPTSSSSSYIQIDHHISAIYIYIYIYIYGAFWSQSLSNLRPNKITRIVKIIGKVNSRQYRLRSCQYCLIHCLITIVILNVHCILFK